MGKHHLGAVGEFVRERFRIGVRNNCAPHPKCAKPDTADNNWSLLKPANRNILFSVQGIHAFFS